MIGAIAKAGLLLVAVSLLPSCATPAQTYTMYVGEGVQQVFIRPFEVKQDGLFLSLDITARFRGAAVYDDAIVNFTVYTTAGGSAASIPNLVFSSALGVYPTESVTLIYRDTERGLARYTSRMPSDSLASLLHDVDSIPLSFEWGSITESDMVSTTLRRRMQFLADLVH